MPSEFSQDYDLSSIKKNWKVLKDVRKGTHGLKHLGRILSYNDLKQHLLLQGHVPTKHKPGYDVTQLQI